MQKYKEYTPQAAKKGPKRHICGLKRHICGLKCFLRYNAAITPFKIRSPKSYFGRPSIGSRRPPTEHYQDRQGCIMTKKGQRVTRWPTQKQKPYKGEYLLTSKIERAKKASFGAIALCITHKKPRFHNLARPCSRHLNNGEFLSTSVFSVIYAC